MKVTEIITNPPRDEYLDRFRYEFETAQPVAKIKNLTLKKSSNNLEINYGLFDENDNLVGYMSLYKFIQGMWEVSLSQLAQVYKGQGYGTFMYDYAVMNDNLKLISDATNTGGPHGSKELWLRLGDNRRYDVVGYNTETREIIPDATPDMIYDNKPNTRWVALPPGQSINESLTAIQSHMKKSYVVWYGPGTTTEDYYNF